MSHEDVCLLSARQLAGMIRARRLSPREAVDAVLARIDRINPALNAYNTILHESARQEAAAAEAAVMRGDRLGPLHGVPFSIKDLIITKGVRTTRGSYIYAEFVPDEDAPVVERLKSAGGIMIGKTATPEFGFKAVTDSPLLGVTHNPWRIGRTPGGSSGGAAAAVAAGLAPLAVGTDGGGSIRIPAALTGVYGFKPSSGLVPLYPASAAGSLSHAGPMAWTVGDAALMLQVMAGPDERDRFSLPANDEDYIRAADVAADGFEDAARGLRVAWSPDLGCVAVDTEVASLTSRAARVFEELGAHLDEVTPNLADSGRAWDTLFYSGIAAGLGEAFDRWRDRLDPALVELVERARRATGPEVAAAMRDRETFWDGVRRFFGDYDLLLTPTVSVAAFETGINGPRTIAGRPAGPKEWWTMTAQWNLTGQPAASVPCGITGDGLPVGLQIVGRRFADATVLRASAAFEAARPWHGLRPQGVVTE